MTWDNTGNYGTAREKESCGIVLLHGKHYEYRRLRGEPAGVVEETRRVFRGRAGKAAPDGL
jgi:hypothetical protein